MKEANKVIDFAGVFYVLRRRWFAFLTTLLLVLAACVLLISMIKPIYRAEANVLIERQVADELISTTITGDIKERLEVLQQKALTKKNLSTVAQELGLLPQVDVENTPANYDRLADQVISEITANLSLEFIDVKVTEQRSGRSSNMVVSFIVAYESEDPLMAAKAANAITQLLLDENKVVRSAKSKEIASFLQNAQTRIQTEIQSIEFEIAKLKENSFDVLPEQLEESRREIGQRKDALIELEGEIGFLNTRIKQLEDNLKQTPKHLVSDKTNSAALQDPKIRLQQARLHLELLQQSFTENHPDVIQTKALIQDLEKQVMLGTSKSADLTLATNPEYLTLSKELKEAQAKLDSTKARQSQVQQIIESLSERFSADPAVELRYSQLLRDLERAQKEYATIKSRLYGAELAKNLEQEEKGERLTLLSRAVPPRDPSWPHYFALYVLSVVVSLVAAGTRVFLSEITDTTIRNTRDMVSITGIPPLGVVPSFDAES